MKWEKLKSGRFFESIRRAKVPGGWLIVVVVGGATAGLTFYPDPKHEWSGETLP